jgi:hypothetical protein
MDYQEYVIAFNNSDNIDEKKNITEVYIDRLLSCSCY